MGNSELCDEQLELVDLAPSRSLRGELFEHHVRPFSQHSEPAKHAHIFESLDMTQCLFEPTRELHDEIGREAAKSGTITVTSERTLRSAMQSSDGALGAGTPAKNQGPDKENGVDLAVTLNPAGLCDKVLEQKIGNPDSEEREQRDRLRAT